MGIVQLFQFFSPYAPLAWSLKKSFLPRGVDINHASPIRSVSVGRKAFVHASQRDFTKAASSTMMRLYFRLRPAFGFSRLQNSIKPPVISSMNWLSCLRLINGFRHSKVSLNVPSSNLYVGAKYPEGYPLMAVSEIRFMDRTDLPHRLPQLRTLNRSDSLITFC